MVTLPFIGVLLARDVRRSPGAVRLTPTLLAATLVATVVGAYGVLVCAAALAVTPSSVAAGRWDHLVSVAVCSVLVQVVAQLVGTGLGLLLRPVVVACLATIVLPLGLWFVLGSVAVLRPAQAWLTPYPTVQTLLSRRNEPAGVGAVVGRRPALGCGAERRGCGAAEAVTTGRTA